MSISLIVRCHRPPPGTAADYASLDVCGMKFGLASGDHIAITHRPANLHALGVTTTLVECLGGVATYEDDGEELASSPSPEVPVTFDELKQRLIERADALIQNERAALRLRRAEWESQAASAPAAYAEANDWSDVGAAAGASGGGRHAAMNVTYRVRQPQVEAPDELSVASICAGSRSILKRLQSVGRDGAQSNELIDLLISAARDARGEALALTLEALARLKAKSALAALDFNELRQRTDASLVASVERTLQR